MIESHARFETVLRSPRPLIDAMTYRRHTVRSLQDAVNRELKKQRQATVSRGTIGNLRAGYSKVCRPEVARAIEEVLDVPQGSLFIARVSTVSRESARQEAGAVGMATVLFGLAFATAVLIGVAYLIQETASLSEYLEQAGQWFGGVFSMAAVVVSPHMIVQRLTVAQAADLAQRSTDTIYTALEDGTLHGSQRCKGGRWSIRPACLDAWLDGENCEHQS